MDIEKVMRLWDKYEDSQTYFAIDTVNALKRQLAEADQTIAELREQIEEMVPKGWEGLLTILNEVYPASIFGGADDDWEAQTRDLGPRLTTLGFHLDAERKAREQAETDVAELQAQRDEAQEERGSMARLYGETMAALRLVTARHDGEQKAKAKAEKEVQRVSNLLATERAERMAEHLQRVSLYRKHKHRLGFGSFSGDYYVIPEDEVEMPDEPHIEYVPVDEHGEELVEALKRAEQAEAEKDKWYAKSETLRNEVETQKVWRAEAERGAEQAEAETEKVRKERDTWWEWHERKALEQAEAEVERLTKRESELEYIAEKWCEHECVSADCPDCVLGAECGGT